MKEGTAAFMVSTLSAITRTFLNHYSYYCRIRGETRQQQINHERALYLEYASRTIFELPQNALDPCRYTVFVALMEIDREGHCLVIGNDGRPISVNADFDYNTPHDPSDRYGRSDFHALCSVDTSNKTPDENFGTQK